MYMIYYNIYKTEISLQNSINFLLQLGGIGIVFWNQCWGGGWVQSNRSILVFFYHNYLYNYWSFGSFLTRYLQNCDLHIFGFNFKFLTFPIHFSVWWIYLLSFNKFIISQKFVNVRIFLSLKRDRFCWCK